jgi:hypothetical protein
MSFKQVNANVRVDKKFTEFTGRYDNFKREVLLQAGKLTVDISKKSMKRVGKGIKKKVAAGKPVQQYDEKVTTTFKSGKKKGQLREFIRGGLYSAPGQPPKNRRNPGLKAQKFVFVDRDTIRYGPLGFRDTVNAKTTNASLPYIHESGGTFMRTLKFPSRKKKKSNLGPPKTNQDFKRLQSFKKGRKGSKDTLPRLTVTGSVRYPKRPFMKPAQDKAHKVLQRKLKSIARRS